MFENGDVFTLRIKRFWRPESKEKRGTQQFFDFQRVKGKKLKKEDGK